LAARPFRQGVVVKAAGQRDARLRVGLFGNERHRQGHRVDERERRRQFVFGGLPAGSRGLLGSAGQRRKALPLRTRPIGVDGDGAGDNGASGQRAVECLP
jgi:hypothetical protein